MLFIIVKLCGLVILNVLYICDNLIYVAVFQINILNIIVCYLNEFKLNRSIQDKCNVGFLFIACFFYVKIIIMNTHLLFN